MHARYASAIQNLPAKREGSGNVRQRTADGGAGLRRDLQYESGGALMSERTPLAI